MVGGSHSLRVLIYTSDGRLYLLFAVGGFPSFCVFKHGPAQHRGGSICIRWGVIADASEHTTYRLGKREPPPLCLYQAGP